MGIYLRCQWQYGTGQNKGNQLSLPRLTTFDNGNTINYPFDTTGVKPQKIAIESGQ
ncbi:MAG: hypothetical protein U5K79_07255 [Cyclobacteriaceae bacterium]|nr:hypothetical protein [Cyclobacteriaceae bacterium]